jgi:hypothetical protein
MAKTDVEPIVIKILVKDDPKNSDHLIITTDPEGPVLLSLKDLDQVRWVTERGNATIDFAPVNNPFDPNVFTGGNYTLSKGGSLISGTVAEVVLEGEDSKVFRRFKYSITVTDGDRAGSLDPHLDIREDSVYGN